VVFSARRPYIAVVAARTLPLFPLPVVLFPGVALPLHIFEPRYRRLLADCLDGDRRFGLIFLPEATAERDLPPGQIGCVARIESAETLADGRSNIIVAGEERFRLERLIDAPEPYHMGEVSAYEDALETDGASLEVVAREVRAAFDRVARAARRIADDRSPPPDLPDDPALLAFRIADAVDTPLLVRYDLLASRSALRRLREMERLLASALGALERRAVLHDRARGNGHGGELQGGAP